MTIAEYVAQENPQRLPDFSVDVIREDCECVWDIAGDTYFRLKAYPEYTYIVPKSRPKCMSLTGAYSTDGDGNPKKPTVFKFIG